MKRPIILSGRTCAAIRGSRCAWLSAALIALVSHPAWAACTVGAQAVAFGSYIPIRSNSVDGTGNVAVNCDSGLAYTIALSSGSGRFEQRTLGNGLSALGYNLYTDAARLTVWGDGSGITSSVAGVGTGVETVIPVYGRIPAAQKVHAGTYTDTIVITVTF